MAYISWKEKILKRRTAKAVEKLYGEGFVMTRKGPGVMQQTRSARIRLSKFSPNSENRRILRKNASISLWEKDIPLSNYDWRIGKTAKDFYGGKFGGKIMSANKIKEMLSDAKKSNFNKLFEYRQNVYEFPLGFAVVLETDGLIHYSYPFYDLDKAPKDLGLGMMTMAIMRAKEKNKKFAYLGSLRRRADAYKAQFDGFEWFTGKRWSKDTAKLKEVLRSESEDEK